MSNSSSYHPSYIVRQIHGIVHSNYKLQSQDADWGLHHQDIKFNSYVESTVVMPVICLIIALLLLVLFTSLLCCYKHGSPNRTYRLLYIAGFIFFIVIAILSDQLIFIGDPIFVRGLHRISDNIDSLKSLFSQFSLDTDSLLVVSEAIRTNVTSAESTCTGASYAVSYVDEYVKYVEEFQSEVSSLSDNLSSADDKYHEYFVGYYQYFLFGLYGLIMFSCVWYALSACFTSKVLANGGTCFSQLFLVVLFVLCTILMIALMLSADFCMDPADNVLQMLEYNSTTYQSTSYYLTCSGYNPLHQYITEANGHLTDLDNYLSGLSSSSCTGNTYLTDARSRIYRSQHLLSNIDLLLDCSTIRGYYDSIIETGYCRDIFQGTYLFWLAFYVAGAALCFVPWFLWGYRDTSSLSDSGGKVLPVEEDDFDEINDIDEVNDPLSNDDLSIITSMEEMENVYRHNFDAYSSSDIKKKTNVMEL